MIRFSAIQLFCFLMLVCSKNVAVDFTSRAQNSVKTVIGAAGEYHFLDSLINKCFAKFYDSLFGKSIKKLPLNRNADLGKLMFGKVARLAATSFRRSLDVYKFHRLPWRSSQQRFQRGVAALKESTTSATASATPRSDTVTEVVVVGAGWGGLSVAHALSKAPGVHVTVVDAGGRPGGLVADGFMTPGGRPAEAGQHGFWDEYSNIFALMDEIGLNRDEILSGYAEQGQYSPNGLEVVWPVYRQAPLQLPAGIGQAIFTRFRNLPAAELATALPLALALSEFDNSDEAWRRYDKISFRDLCVKLGVSRRLYREAFEPMILTGLFAPGEECSAAAALGMAYFFVLKHQNSFDLRWCRGNIGEKVFAPWVERMEARGVTFMQRTRVTGVVENEVAAKAGMPSELTGVRIRQMDSTGPDNATAGAASEERTLRADKVVFAVGGAALAAITRASPALSKHSEFRRFTNLRGLSVLATRLFLDRQVSTPHTANPCWGFDDRVGMTWFDIGKLHGLEDEIGSVIEVDYYHANELLVLDDSAIVAKAKSQLDRMLGAECEAASVVDAAVVRLPNAVNWYPPGSYDNLPSLQSAALPNVYFVGDLVKSNHGSWSQEKAYVTGVEAADAILGRPVGEGVIPLTPDEPHVAFGRTVVGAIQSALGGKETAPSLADFSWR